MAVNLKTKDNIATIEFDTPDSKVNILTAEVIGELNTILDKVQQDSSLKAVVLVSKKKDIFIAGADIREIEGITDPDVGVSKAEAGQQVFNRIEDLSIPSIAVIDGVALGGGCEIALACTYRIATFNEKVRIGLPEVNLGIVPGFGGTYRMPRVVGLTEGLKLIVSGRPIDAQKALKVGLVDRLYAQAGLERDLDHFIDEVTSSKVSFRKKKKGLKGFLDNTFFGHLIVFNATENSVRSKTKGFYPAPEQAVEVVKKNFFMDREQGLKLEAVEFSKLVVTDISKNLVKLFYMSEKYKKLIPEGADGVKGKRIEHCGVLGAGIMGGGIAQILAYKDIWVRVKDLNYDALALGLRSAAKVFKQAVKRRKLKRAQAERKMAQITTTVDYSGFQKADMVIEAVIENMDIKKKVFKEISENVPDDTILCSNTSALSVTEMTQEAKDPSKVIGLHFFNPVHRMPLVEIITTEQTSMETVVTTLNLAKRLGKTPILVKDAPGFLVNRILLGYINEAGRILEEGHKIEEIDKIMTRFGMPMGPFTLSDEVGLDVGVKVLHILQEGLGERFKPTDIFEKINEQKLLGKKSGVGFYKHGKIKTPNAQVYQSLDPAKRADGDGADFLERMLLIMINEAAMCLDEGIVPEPEAVDIGMVMGTGFPAFRGGLLRYADSVGIENIFDTLTLFEGKFQDGRFKPCSYIMDLKNKQKGFYS